VALATCGLTPCAYILFDTERNTTLRIKSLFSEGFPLPASPQSKVILFRAFS
jgi:hypothetical protein